MPVREQQHHDVRQHAGLGHGQHDEMELENMLPLQQMVNFGQDDDMLEHGARPSASECGRRPTVRFCKCTGQCGRRKEKTGIP